MSAIQECNVAGEIRPVPLSDLVPNAAVEYLLANPKSKPRWCLRKTPHDILTCTFLHRTPDKASNYVMIRGEPAPVCIGHLIQNKGLEMILGSMEAFGEWCDLASPHDIVMCKRLHLGAVPDDKTVKVEGEEAPVSVSHLLLNRGVSYLLTFPDAKGVWCNNKIVHDVVNCPYIHRRIDGHPKVVNVEEEKFPVPVNQLILNAALTFLLDNPQCSGRWCGRVVNHDVEQCSYLHRRQPFVRVDGDTVRINTIKSNRGLKYLLEHPEAQGHWCRSTHDEQHPLETCTFIHPKEGKEYQAEAALSRLDTTATPNASSMSGRGNGRRLSGNNEPQHRLQPNYNSRGGYGGDDTHALQQRGRGNGGGLSSGVGALRAPNVLAPPHHINIPPNTFGFGGHNASPSYFPQHNNSNPNYGQFSSHQQMASPPPNQSFGGGGHQQQQQQQQGSRRPQVMPVGQNLPQRSVAGRVNVEGQAVDAHTLVNNPGLQYLLNSPTFATGRFCTRLSDPNHRPEICKYIHKL